MSSGGISIEFVDDTDEYVFNLAVDVVLEEQEEDIFFDLIEDLTDRNE